MKSGVSLRPSLMRSRGDNFDDARVKEAGELRVASAEKLRAAVQKALQQTHALLNPEQRQRLSYLLRTGVLTI